MNLLKLVEIHGLDFLEPDGDRMVTSPGVVRGAEKRGHAPV